MTNQYRSVHIIHIIFLLSVGMMACAGQGSKNIPQRRNSISYETYNNDTQNRCSLTASGAGRRHSLPIQLKRHLQERPGQLKQCGIPQTPSKNTLSSARATPCIWHKQEKTYRQIQAGRQYYNDEIHFYDLLGLDQLERTQYIPERIILYTPFFTHVSVRDALLHIHQQKENGIFPIIRVYTSRKAITNPNLGRDHLRSLIDAGISVYVIDHLHAKLAHIVYRDNDGTHYTRSILGSANITRPGFYKNVESWMLVPEDMEDAFQEALRSITSYSWRYYGQTQRGSKHHLNNRTVRATTPPRAILETASSAVNAQIAQSINHTHPGDRVIMNTYALDDPTCINALYYAYHRGVTVDVCLHKGSQLPSSLPCYQPTSPPT